MIDIAAMIACVLGFGFLAIGLGKLGFLVSLIGSLLWLIYAIQRKGWALCAQSIFFAVFSAIGLYR